MISTYLRQAHNVAKGREDEDSLAEELICNTVHKLTGVQAAQEVLLPLTDGVEPVHSASHDLRVQLPAPIARALHPPSMFFHSSFFCGILGRLLDDCLVFHFVDTVTGGIRLTCANSMQQTVC